ncbi:FxDxF family PEP-CTERM protein [Pseudoduganella rivuli]|nr:FxDxF family PEP-CTERM protein [Pseudoduganella rivuli]
MNKTLSHTLSLAAASLLWAGAASADIGTASVNDVTLAGDPADAFAYMAGWNPHAGPNGDTSGFDAPFAPYGSGTWSLLDKLDSSSGLQNTGPLTFTFTPPSGTSGGWSVTNTSMTSSVTLDLAFAMHAGNQGGAWLFDNQAILPGQTLNGTWAINWTVGNGQANNPGFSNLTLFARDMVTTPVPEPETYGMLLAGLGVLGMVARRRKLS